MENVVELKQAKSKKIQWATLTAMVIFHPLAIWALFEFSWTNLLAAAVTWWIAGSVGIGLGYHRLLTHRGFKAPKWLEYIFTACGTLALQAGPLAWVTTHRMHHAYTDTDKDPHSPKNGFFWAHMGWILKGDAQNHDEAVHKRFSPDLVDDKVHRFMENYYWLSTVLTAGVLFAIGGWSMVLWGVFLRTVLGWHFTWFVNSVTHIWGNRRFETKDTSTNNAWVAMVSFGEGWHNNHHAYPRSAKHGLSWKEIDFNWMQIWALEKVGLLKDVYALDLENTKNDAKTLRKAA